MMSHESHHLHLQHPFHEFSAMAANSSTMNNFETGGHDLFNMDMPANHNWRGFPHESGATVSVAAASPWPIQSLHTNQLQSLSLSLYNPPQPPSFQPSSHLQPFHIKSCKYLLPTQDLINEFCSLGEGNSFKRNINGTKPPSMDHDSSSSWSQQSLYSMEPLELQKRKANLLSMLEEVDRRYRRYCEQMKAVVSTFEDIAGEGAARTYSQLASKAMSRHFRCLRDGIAGQIRATRRAMGENEGATTASRGETPRLKLLDQCLRQQKTFQQTGMMESHPWRPQRGLPDRSVSILRAWLFEHFLHPYPSDVDKHILSRQTGLSRSQVSNWFINARVRLWKPMIEEMYMEELKEEDKNSQSSHATTMREAGNSSNDPYSNPNPSPSFQPPFEDRKPKTYQLQLDEQNSLSSILNNINAHHHHNPNPNPNQNFGILETDFGSYRGHELTLSLQQHERPLAFARELPIGDEGDEVQFSILEGESQNIPYRNLMGAQLLHDLAG